MLYGLIRIRQRGDQPYIVLVHDQMRPQPHETIGAAGARWHIVHLPRQGGAASWLVEGSSSAASYWGHRALDHSGSERTGACDNTESACKKRRRYSVLSCCTYC